jgi:hypothetical protein
MEWVSGPTLLAAVDRAAAAGNTGVIQALATGLTQMWNDLQGIGFVHGDLTAQNVMIRGDGQLVLVDLDTATWRGAPFGPGPGGQPGYIIDRFRDDALERDAFAMLVMQASLRAIADNPGLRARFGEDLNRPDGKLLFSAFDLHDSYRSLALAEARHHAGRDTQRLLDGLQAALEGGRADLVDALSLVPRLQVPAELGDTSSFPTWVPASGVDDHRSVHYHYNWPEVVEAAPVPPSSTDPSPGWTATWQPPEEPTPDLPPEASVADLRLALEDGNESEVIRLASILADSPAAALLAGRVEQVIATGYERRIRAEAAAGRDAGVVAEVDEAARRQVPLDAELYRMARAAQERLDVRAELEAAIATEDHGALAELAVSGRLVVLGDTDRATLRKVLQAIERPSLDQALATDDDMLILSAWDPDLFDEGDAEITEVLDRVRLAEARVAWLESARAALKRRSPDHMMELLVDPPPGATERLSPGERRRMLKEIESRRALATLQEALASDDDAAVISALNAVERIGARIPERATWQRIQQVVERVELVDDVIAAADQQPMDRAKLAHLLPAVRALGLERDPRFGDPDWVEAIERQVVRHAHLRRIQAAIGRDNDIAILAAIDPDPHQAIDLLEPAELERVERARAGRRKFTIS